MLPFGVLKERLLPTSVPGGVVYVSAHAPHERPREHQPQQRANVGVGSVEPLGRVQHASEKVQQGLREVVRIRRYGFLALFTNEGDAGLQVPMLRNDGIAQENRVVKVYYRCLRRVAGARSMLLMRFVCVTFRPSLNPDTTKAEDIDRVQRPCIGGDALRRCVKEDPRSQRGTGINFGRSVARNTVARPSHAFLGSNTQRRLRTCLFRVAGLLSGGTYSVVSNEIL